MSKYTPVELRDMAQAFLILERRGDMRCLQARMIIGAMTGMSDNEITVRIRGFAGSFFKF